MGKGVFIDYDYRDQGYDFVNVCSIGDCGYLQFDVQHLLANTVQVGRTVVKSRRLMELGM
jgi:hypothetical protein